MAIDWARLKEMIVEGAVSAVNGELYDGLDRAERDVPVRKVFSGGRQTVRFKSASEIENDRGLRSKLGLAPEILATPEDVARFRASGINPKRSAQVAVTDFRTDRVARSGAAAAQSGRVPLTQGGTSVGFARTVTHPDRANSWKVSGKARELSYDHETGAVGPDLKDAAAVFGLTSRGRYELRTGRATSRKFSPQFDENTGHQVMVGGPAHLGGGLKKTLRVVKASAATYPVIKGSLVAGDAEHDYAKFQELGTRHNAAHPFLRPRLPEWATGIRRRLKRVMGRLGR